MGAATVLDLFPKWIFWVSLLSHKVEHNHCFICRYATSFCLFVVVFVVLCWVWVKAI